MTEQFVVVTDPGNEELVELPTNADSSLSASVLDRAIPGAYGLKYKNLTTGAFRALLFDESGSRFLPPSDGWSGKIFTVVKRQLEDHHRGQEVQREQTATGASKRKRLWTSSDDRNESFDLATPVHAVSDKEPVNIDYYKEYIYYSNIHGRSAPVTIVNDKCAYGSYHIFKEFISTEGEPQKTLEIHGQFVCQTFKVVVDKFCKSPTCQVIRFRPLEPNNFGIKRSHFLHIGIPMIGWSYYALGYPGENAIQYCDQPLNISYLSGVISSATSIYLIGSSGSRPDFLGGPVFGAYVRQLLGFVIAGGPDATNLKECCWRFEQVRYMIARNAFHEHPTWAHDDSCISNDEDSSGESRPSSAVDGTLIRSESEETLVGDFQNAAKCK